MNKTQLIDRAFIKTAAQQLIDFVTQDVDETKLTWSIDYLERALTAYKNSNKHKELIGEDYLD